MQRSPAARVEKALPEIGPKTKPPETRCFTWRTGLRAKTGGGDFSKNAATLEHQAESTVWVEGGARGGLVQNTRDSWPQSGRDLGLVAGPPGPPEGARRGPGASKGTQNTTYSWDFQKTTKNKLFEHVHHSRVPGPFWPKRVADRTPITTDSCVFRSGLKSGPREPKG